MTSTAEGIRGNEDAIIHHFGLPPITGHKHYRGECPLCSKKDKFRLHFYNDNLVYICVCGSGNLFNLLGQVTGKEFQDIAAEIDKIIGREYKPVVGAKPVVKPATTFMEKWEQLERIKGTPVQEYLMSRGIYNMPKNSVRYSPAEYDQSYGRSFEAMYCVASDEFNNPCYIHKTYLDGGKKADVAQVKKLKTIRKSQGSIAIKMFPATTALGIAEGIETALSAHQVYKVPVWPVLNTSFMKSFKAPLGVEYLMIFADNDNNGAGLAAAFVCGNKNILANNDVKKVSIRWSDKEGDFNDVLEGGLGVIEWILVK